MKNEYFQRIFLPVEFIFSVIENEVYFFCVPLSIVGSVVNIQYYLKNQQSMKKHFLILF
jgi:hypothetical protein